MNKILIVARREFLTRVQKKTFLLTTILLPLLIFGFYALMIYFSVKGSDTYTIAVTDQTNTLEKVMGSNNKEVAFTFLQDETEAGLKNRLDNKEFDGYIYIPSGSDVTGRDTIRVIAGKKAGISTIENVEDRINKALEEKQLLSYNLTKLQLDSLQKSGKVKFVSIKGEEESKTKAGISYGVGFISGFLIYIILFIYGTMVMRGVMEEKVSRISEVIVSSVKPFQLMMGKILGIGGVGLLQFIIWGVIIVSLQFLLPFIFPGLAEQMQSGAMQSPQMAQAGEAVKNSGGMSGLMQGLSEVNFGLIIGCFLFYFVGGYLLYSSLFAAVGSAVNEDPQDAQSLLLPITMPIIFAIVIMMKTVNEPNSGLALFGSMFPLTSPIVMMARVAHGIPDGVTWIQLIISMLLLIGGFIFTTWLAGKIYRTGILLYGKKVTWKEMIKWVRR
ncbi:MAG: ABC transporter permease [Terrimonas sp.]|nr:ABC transporter permease [Terrimonas sp.]